MTNSEKDKLEMLPTLFEKQLNKGSNIEIRKSKDGYVVYEVTKKIIAKIGAASDK